MFSEPDNYPDNLLELGRSLCSSDYAVRFFHAPQHPQFFGNTPALLKAVRKAAGRLPKSQRAVAAQCIDAALKVWNTDDDAFRRAVLKSEQALMRVLLRLNDVQLFQLFTAVDFGDHLDDEDYWLETLGIGFVEEGPEDARELIKKPIVESLHAHLEALLLPKKKQHHEIAWIAYGLATVNTDVAIEGMPNVETVSCRYEKLATWIASRFPENHPSWAGDEALPSHGKYIWRKR